MIKFSNNYFQDLDKCLESLKFKKYDLNSGYGAKLKNNLQSNDYQQFDGRLYMPKINAIWILESSEDAKNPVICYHAQNGHKKNNTSLAVGPCKRLNENLLIEQGLIIENDILMFQPDNAILINLDNKTTIDKDVQGIKSRIQEHLTKLEQNKDFQIKQKILEEEPETENQRKIPQEKARLALSLNPEYLKDNKDLQAKNIDTVEDGMNLQTTNIDTNIDTKWIRGRHKANVPLCDCDVDI